MVERGPGNQVPAKCRQCERPLGSPLFCTSCHTLHPADSYSFFEIFGLPTTYDLDLGALRRLYLQSSRAIHPDFHGARPEEAALSLRTTAKLNEAYRVLSDPRLRAEYLLELAGGKSSADDKSVAPEILSTTLLLHEELEEARTQGAAAVAQVVARIQDMYDAALAAAAGLARQLPGDEALRERLRQQLNAARYSSKLLQSV